MRPKSIRPNQPKNNFSRDNGAPKVGDWVDRETAGCRFADLRLERRFGKVLGQMSEHVGATVPFACQDWANTKAAYRFFGNERVNEADILAGHFEATRSRMAAVDGRVFVLYDTTSFSYQREDDSDLGELNHF